MEESEMIDLYEELVETIQQLNKDAPKIRELYDNTQSELVKARSALQGAIAKAKEELSKAEGSGVKKISDLSSSRKKQIDEQLKALDEVVQKAAKLQKELGVTSDSVQTISKQYSALSRYLDQVVENEEKQHAYSAKLEKRIIALEAALLNLNPPMKIDYSELASAIDLYKKYNGRIGRPVVLEKENYVNDYCFRVSGVDEEQGKLIGRYFRQGKIYGTQNTFPFTTKCRMFNGTTLNEVISEEL